MRRAEQILITGLNVLAIATLRGVPGLWGALAGGAFVGLACATAYLSGYMRGVREDGS